MAEGQPKLGLGTKLAYGLGTVAFGTKDAGFNTFLLIFYNQVMGVPATLVSLAIAIALVADAIFDPLIGAVSDNWRSRLGRRHPFMYGAALPVALFYFLLWNPPHLPVQQLFFYLLGTAVLVRIAIASYEIPSTALAPELSPDYDERTSLMAYRMLFLALGAGITITVALVFFMRATTTQHVGILNKDGYFNYSLMAVFFMSASILISAYGTHGRIHQFKQLPKRAQISLGRVLRETFTSLSNESFLLVTIASMFGGMALGIGNTLATYFGTYFWKFTPQQLSVLGISALLASFIALWLAPIVSRRLGKKRAYIISAFGSIIVNNLAMTLKLLGLLPPDGSNALLAVFFLSWTIGLSLGIASFICVLSMISDVVEDSELKTGRRSEGLFSASSTFVAKSTGGVGVLIAGLLIDFVHFPKHATPATIDPHIVRNLALCYMPLQIALSLIAVSVLSFYRIDRKTHESNLARIADAAVLVDAAEEGSEVPRPVEAPSSAAADHIAVALEQGAAP